MVQNAVLLATAAALTLACGGDDKLRGDVHKGPMAANSAVTVTRIVDGEEASSKATTTKELGAYSIDAKPGRGKRVVISATGTYFDELTGEESASPVRLRAVHVGGSGGKRVGVNLVTELTFERHVALLDGGEDPDVGGALALAELHTGMGLLEGTRPVAIIGTELSLTSDDPQVGAYLFAISAIYLRAAEARGAGTLNSLIEETIADLADDGALEATLTSELVAAQRSLDTQAAEEALGQLFGDDTPDIDLVIDTDGDLLVNADDNCPYHANADQADADGDDKGDACENFFQQVVGVATDEVDVLFVVDDSGSMRQEQINLAANNQNFFAALAAGGPLPDMHVGVVSTNAGGDGAAECVGTGDNGNLINTPRVQQNCMGPTDRWIASAPDADGGRIINYPGAQTLSETFACIAELGTDGCGFEQPLESMKRALENPANDGFLRENSVLAVVFLTDEDDCSVHADGGTAVFAPSPTCLDYFDPVECALGALASFRCFEFGVKCDPDAPRELGEKSSCAPRVDAPYMPDSRDFADVLRAAHPGRSVIGVITGPAGPVEVESRDQQLPGVGVVPIPALLPSCSAEGTGEASPAVRLQGFATKAGTSQAMYPICTEDFSPFFVDIANRIRANLSGSCLITEPIPSSCVVNDVQADDPASVVQTLVSCADNPSEPCFTLQEDGDCPSSGYSIALDRQGTVIPANSVALVTCDPAQ